MEEEESVMGRWRLYDKLSREENEQPGIYRVRLFRGGKPIHIARFLGIDKDAVLSIGKTKNLKSRHSKFFSAVKNGKAKHSEGRWLHHLLKWRLLVLKESDGIVWECYRADRNSIDQREAIEMRRYIRRFGEAPPLNSNIPDRYGEG